MENFENLRKYTDGRVCGKMCGMRSQMRSRTVAIRSLMPDL
jgi:hypothetical protein